MSDTTVTDRPGYKVETPVTFALAGLLVLGYLVQQFVDARYGEETVHYLFYMEFTRVWTWITYVFAHLNEIHLALNGFFLLLFGRYLEREHGGRTLAAVYLLSGILTVPMTMSVSALINCGIGATFVSCLVDGSGGVGASGALFGLFGFQTSVRPRGDVYLLFTSRYKMPMWAFSAILVAVSLLGMYTPFDPVSAVIGAPVGHRTHLVALAVGAVLGRLGVQRA